MLLDVQLELIERNIYQKCFQELLLCCLDNAKQNRFVNTKKNRRYAIYDMKSDRYIKMNDIKSYIMQRVISGAWSIFFGNAGCFFRSNLIECFSMCSLRQEFAVYWYYFNTRFNFFMLSYSCLNCNRYVTDRILDTCSFLDCRTRWGFPTLQIKYYVDQRGKFPSRFFRSL